MRARRLSAGSPISSTLARCDGPYNDDYHRRQEPLPGASSPTQPGRRCEIDGAAALGMGRSRTPSPPTSRPSSPRRPGRGRRPLYDALWQVGGARNLVYAASRVQVRPGDTSLKKADGLDEESQKRDKKKKRPRYDLDVSTSWPSIDCQHGGDGEQWANIFNRDTFSPSPNSY